MGFFDNVERKINANNLITLTLTTELTDETLKLLKWKELLSAYKQDDPAPEFMCMTSIANSILTQNRIFFVLTRDKTESMIRNDKNWKDAKFNNKHWNLYLKYMYDNKFIQQVFKAGRTPVYEVTMQPILAFLDVNYREQKEETSNYVNRIKKSILVKNSTKENNTADEDEFVESKYKRIILPPDNPGNFHITAGEYAIKKIIELHGEDAPLLDDPIIDADRQKFIDEKMHELLTNYAAKNS